MEITQAQKYEILEHELLNGAGLEEILKKCLEILMKQAHEIHNENRMRNSPEEILPREYKLNYVKKICTFASPV